MNYKLINNPSDCLSPLEQILYNRGIPIEEIEHYCNTNYLDILDPLLLDNMRKGAQLLISSIKDNKKMYVQVD